MTDENRFCPHPDREWVVCPACRAHIRGVVPAGTPEEPAARCPVCDEQIDSVVVPE